MSDELNHGCKKTCSGWQDGYKQGQKDLFEVISEMRAEIATLKKKVQSNCPHCKGEGTLSRMEEGPGGQQFLEEYPCGCCKEYKDDKEPSDPLTAQ